MLWKKGMDFLVCQNFRAHKTRQEKKSQSLVTDKERKNSSIVLWETKSGFVQQKIDPFQNYYC